MCYYIILLFIFNVFFSLKVPESRTDVYFSFVSPVVTESENGILIHMQINEFESLKNIDYNFKFKTAPTIAGLVVLKTKLENVSWVLDKADFELCRIKGLQCRQGIDQDGVYNKTSQGVFICWDNPLFSILRH